MNKIVKAVGLIALAAMVVVTVGSCDLVALSVSGSVVNVQAPKDSTSWWKSTDGTYSLDGAEITLTNLKTASTYTGTVSSGAYTIVGVPAGTYKVTGSAKNWTFVPRQVDLTGYLNTLPNILAYVTPSGTNKDQVLVMVEWGNLSMDVDSYMARDTDPGSTYNGTPVAGYNLGGGYYSDPHGYVSLDRDVTQNSDSTIPRVETIRVSSPVSAVGFEQLRYYLRLFNQTTGSLTGNSSASSASATATVFVMQGTEHLGTYQIAIDSDEVVLGVVQMEWTLAGSDPAHWTIGSFANPYFTNGDNTGTTGIKSISTKPVVVKVME